MKPKKKPTLKQLEQRSALWYDHVLNGLKITYAEGDLLNSDEGAQSNFYGKFSKKWLATGYTRKDMLRYSSFEFIGFI